MHFPIASLALAAQFSTFVLSAPAVNLDRRAASASVLKDQTYNQLSISGGTAGNAKAEALAKFPIDMANLAGVSAADLKIIKAAHNIAENAELKAFDPQLAKVSGAAATALQNGKIKNKVLKLTAEVLGLQIQQAQGDSSVASDLATESKKLTNNIALDTKAVGQASTALSFGGSD